MKSSVFEIEKGIFRLSVAPTEHFEFNHFLIVDEKCMLIHTGGKKLFGTLCRLVSELIDLEKLDYIAFSHIESDECGSLNEWLKVAPRAIPVCGTIGKSTVEDYSDKHPEIMENGHVILLGKHKVMLLSTPHIPHGWEALLFFEINNGILFSSDLGAQPGICTPVTEQDITPQMLQFVSQIGFMPVGENLNRVIGRLKELEINYLATMHGSTLKGKYIRTFFDRLLEN